MSTTTEISKGVVSVGTWNLTKIITSAIAYPILARLLGADGYGQYAYCLAVIMLASPFANMGITYVLTKHLAERPGDLVWRRNLAAFCGLTNLIATLSVGAVVSILLLRYPVSGRNPVIMAGVVVGIIILEQVWFYSRGILYGLHREELATLPATLGAIVSAGLGIGFALSGMGVLGVLTGILIANLAVAIVTFRYTYQVVEWSSGSDIFRELPVLNLATIGLSSMLFTTFSLALYRADIILVRHLASDAQAGLYAAAVQWSQFVWFVPMAVEAMLLQATTPLWGEGHVGLITDMLSRWLRHSALVTAFFLVFIFVFADHVMQIFFGSDFSGASLMLRILVPGALAFSFARDMWPVIYARSHAFLLVVVIASAVLVNLTLNWFLIRQWGAAGASVAASVSFACVLLAYSVILRSWGVEPLAGFSIGRFFFLCIVTTACLAPVSLSISSAPAAVLIGGILGASIYWAGALRLGLLHVDEILHFLNSLPEPLQSFCRKIFSVLQPTLLRIEVGMVGK